MHKFEYEIWEADFRDNIGLGTDFLNGLGAQGWELVCVVPIKDTKKGIL